jgi:hypothetical protein
MKRANVGFARPHGFRDFEFVRAGPDGAYWQAADGMVVRVAAAERRRARAREAEALDTPLAESGYEIAPGRIGAWCAGGASAKKSYGCGGCACGLNASGSWFRS